MTDKLLKKQDQQLWSLGYYAESIGTTNQAALAHSTLTVKRGVRLWCSKL